MSTVTLPSGVVIDTDVITVWNPATLIEMRFQAESLGDFQTARVKISNRLKRYNKGAAKKLLPRADSVDYAVFFTGPERAEKEMYKRLVINYKKVVPVAVREWQEATPGLGPDLLARLIGLIGNPRIALPEHMETVRDEEDEDVIESGKLLRVPVPDAFNADGEPLTYQRTVRQLWSYCGIGDPGRVLTKDMSQEELLARGRRRARAVLFNMGNSIVRVGHDKRRAKPSPYIYLYEATKLGYEMKVHTVPCIRCGTPGRPAQPGSAWKDKHKDESAKRIVAKAILKDLWQRS